MQTEIKDLQQRNADVPTHVRERFSQGAAIQAALQQ